MSDDLSRDPIFLTIQQVISKVARIPLEAIVPENPVTGIANVDSIVLLEIVARTELEFDIEIDEEDLFSINTVHDFVAACRQLVSARA